MTPRLDDVAARATARSLDDILGELEALHASRARTLAMDAIDAMLQLYGEGLARIVAAHREGRLSLEFLGGDDVVAQLLSVHDLLPRRGRPPELVQLGRRRSVADGDDDILALLEDGATQCQLCAAPIGTEHRHLLDVEHRQLACACQACSILFDGQTAALGRYRLVPRRYASLDRDLLDGGIWDRLEIPVDVAFVFLSSTANRPVAFYPGPMGTTESILQLPAWEEVVARNEILATLAPDLEALLVRRSRGARDYMIVPVDECYRLAGAMRVTWEGISGGDRMRRTVDAFFRELARRGRRGQNHQQEIACTTM
jgi:hypothetical protein